MRWTCKSTGQLALALTRGGHPVRTSTVGVMLKEQGNSLRPTSRPKWAPSTPIATLNSANLNEQARQFRDAGLPVISVDCKKRELIGEFKNGGREWQPKGEPVPVNVHDFVSEQGKAIPYGIYDIERNVGWVTVGQDHETAAFAIESLRRWWRGDGVLAYPDADQLLICADGVQATATEFAPGSTSSGASPWRPVWRSPSVTCRPGSGPVTGVVMEWLVPRKA